MIWIVNKTGQAKNQKRLDEDRITKQSLKNDKTLLTDGVVKLTYVKKEELETTIRETCESIAQKMTELKRVKEK